MERIMTVSEAATQLRQSVYTVRNWIKSGKLEASKMGRGYLIREESIQDLLALSRRVSATRTASTGTALQPGRRKLDLQGSLRLMRELQQETMRSRAATASTESVLHSLQSREQESRDELRRLFGGDRS